MYLTFWVPFDEKEDEREQDLVVWPDRDEPVAHLEAREVGAGETRTHQDTLRNIGDIATAI